MPSPDHPLISFVLLAYNQEKFIRGAVEGALSQTYSPLEIMLSDDCSNDRTFEIMREMATAYKGQHKIVLNRNSQNLGLVRHYNRVLQLASGEIVEPAAGDDVSMPQRTEKSWQVLHEHPDAMCVSFAAQQIDAGGNLIITGYKENRQVNRYSIQNYFTDLTFHLNGATRAFRKSVMTTFGPFRPKCPTEDSTTLLRCLLLGNAYYSNEFAIYYRIHGGSLSAPINLHQMKHVEIYKQYKRDIRFACEHDFISADLASKLAVRMRLGFRRRVLNAKLYQSGFSLHSTLAIMCSDSYSRKEKLFLFKQTVRRAVKKQFHCRPT